MSRTDQRPAKPLPGVRCRRPRGATLIYATACMTVMFGFASFVVDFGRVRSAKAELQRCADAAALAALNAYADTNDINAAYTAVARTIAANRVDAISNKSPTVAMVAGRWMPATRTLDPNIYGTGGYPAGTITLSRTAANNNGIELIFGRVLGIGTVNISASATAALIPTDSAPLTVPSTSNPYLGNTPPGSTTPWGDNTTNAAPYGVVGIDVVPGTWITVTGAAGTTSIVPGTTGYYGPDGEPTRHLNHGENWDGTPQGIGPENGIADAILPACAMFGLFLTDAAPNATPAPSTVVDWTSDAMKNQTSYSNLEVKAPFFTGDGLTSGGVTQRFLVPPGATKLYLGIWDGVCSSNNGGSPTATINLRRNVRLVK